MTAATESVSAATETTPIREHILTGSGTGCVSVRTVSGVEIPIDRIIEYVIPELESYTISVDVFVHNTTDEVQGLLVLHRGSLYANNESSRAWDQDAPDWLTQRILALHKKSDTITIDAKGAVVVDGQTYKRWDGAEPERVIGSEPYDVPFSMWCVAGFAPHERYVFRLGFSMSKETFKKHVGETGVFYSYGDGILLDKIEYEDLPSYERADAKKYTTEFERFKRCARMIPQVFEYVIVTQGQCLKWEVTTLSPTLSVRAVCGDIQKNTRWFAADCSDKWSVMGQRSNRFVLKLAHEGTEAP